MTSVIYSNGNIEVTVPASEKVGIYSRSAVKLFQQVGYPNYPSQWDLITTTTAGSEYTSAAFTNETVIRMEASEADAFYEVGAAPSIFEPSGNLSMSEAAATISGLAAAQGGSVQVKGGTSSTAGNAGGAALLTGGQSGSTGVGGAATIAAGAGGSASGAGGVASVTGGAGTAGNATGGVSKVVGGAGQGTGAGGAAQVTGGASGAGATGDGGDVAVAGGAAGSTNGNGGSIALTPGAKAGTGIAGGIFQRSNSRFVTMPAPQTAADTASLTDAQMLSGVLECTPTAAAAYTVRTGTQLKAALPVDLAADDAFDLVLINLGGTGDDITLTAAADITIVGDAVVRPGADSGTEQAGQGTFRFRFTTGNTFIAYRIS